MISILFMPLDLAVAGPLAGAIAVDAALAVAATVALLALPDVWRLRSLRPAAAAP